jgi:hypothetical protein
MKSKTRFMIGYNAGSRHEKLGVPVTPGLFADKSPDYIAGHGFGVADRRAGVLTDNDAATRRIDVAWGLYSQGAPLAAPVVSLIGASTRPDDVIPKGA